MTITIFFRPKEDITAFEVAQLMANVGFGQALKFGLIISGEDWKEMGNAQRHWSLKKETIPPK